MIKLEPVYVTQGSTFLKDVIPYDDTNTAINLSTYTAVMHISKYFGSTTVYTPSVSIVAPGVGQPTYLIRVQMTDEFTTLLPYGTMTYTISITKTDETGAKYVVQQGPLVVTPSV